jgi:glycosyltransferase involved in cell wall biosynthesis
MILGIDAFNIRGGGCLTHIIEILSVINPLEHGFERVIIWGNCTTLAKIHDRPWLKKVHVRLLDKPLPYRLFWHRFMSKKVAQQFGCNLVFVPGGSDANGFYPIVTMSQNMLPFEWHEIGRHRSPLSILRLLLIRWTQINSFRNANGVIFLTNYARNTIIKASGFLKCESVIVPHGVNPRFYLKPRMQSSRCEKCLRNPWRILYVSAIYVYKHQWNVVEAVALLRSKGFPISLELIGPSGDGSKLLNDAINKFDPQREFTRYYGAVAYEDLNSYYSKADIGVFASSCENMPNILIEKMASGLPIACSSMGPMPEILGESGVYFDPCNPNSIASAITKLMLSARLRRKCANSGFERSQLLSWEICANETFQFLAKISRQFNKQFK